MKPSCKCGHSPLNHCLDSVDYIKEMTDVAWKQNLGKCNVPRCDCKKYQTRSEKNKPLKKDLVSEILAFISLLRRDSFDGWTPDQISGYLTATKSIEDKIIELT